MKAAGYFLIFTGVLSCFFTGRAAAQRITFDALPADWVILGKPFTRAPSFEIKDNPAEPGRRWLSMTSDNASGSLISGDPLPVDLKKTPIMRWRWRATALPPGGDGRDPKADDQAIGIYVSSGNRTKQQSVAYRWETQTPVGAEGTAQYAKIIAVKWFALRDQSHADGETFFIEERNVAEDFKKTFGSIPDQIAIGISCNSQYTDSASAAQLDWIEFCSAAPNPTVSCSN